MIRTQTLLKTETETETDTSTETDTGQVNPAPESKGLSLLHVEDNPADALLMQEYLRGILPNVEFDTSERLADLSPERAGAADCAILDLSLPDASGLDALIALRGMSEQLPIIVLTGFEDLEVGLSALRYGADDYLVKNHVDGFTLERAVRYAIERRKLSLDLVNESTAAMLATLDARESDARAERASRGEHRGDMPDPADAAVGTHQVAVRIDGETGEYALICETCDWKAEQPDEDQHSWRDRSLDWVLMRHVAFGDLPDAASVLPTPSTREAVAARKHAKALEEVGDPTVVKDPMPRRAMLSPGHWLLPKGNPDEQTEPAADAAAALDSSA